MFPRCFQANSEKLFYLVVSVTSVLCYINTLGCDFVFDDQSAIKSNKDVRPTTPVKDIFFDDFWGTPMDDEKSHGSYRPLCVLTFRLNYLLSALEPMTYHLVNVIIHVIVSLLVYWCLKLVGFFPSTSFLASIMFALHPIHTEAVAGVVGRAELLSATFFLATLIFYILSIKWHGIVGPFLLLVSLACIPLATLSKETGITVAGLLILYEVVMHVDWQPRKPLATARNLFNLGTICRVLAVIVASLFFLFVRLKLMPQMPHFSVLDNPAAHAPSPKRQLTYAYLVPINALLLLYPWPLVADWALGTVPIVEDFADVRNALTCAFFLLFIIAAFVILLRSPLDRPLAFCFSFVVIPFIPASNLFFPVGFVVAERVLYLPSVGWCALVALGFERVFTRFIWKSQSEGIHADTWQKADRKSKSKLVACLYLITVVLAAFFLRSFCRNYDWSNQVSLFRAGLRFNQRNAKLFNNVGHTYESDAMWHEAFAYFYKAVRTHPTDVGAHRNCARALRNLGQPLYAQRSLRRAISLIPTTATVPKGVKKTRVTPAHLDAFLDLASLLAVSGGKEALEEAEDLYNKVLAMRPDYLAVYERRGEIMFKLRNLPEARKMFKTALSYNKACGNCYYNLAVVDIAEFPHDSDKLSAALGLLDMALQIDPEHYHAMHAFASVVQENRVFQYYDKARDYLRQVVRNAEATAKTNQNKELMPYAVSENAAKMSDAYFRAAMLETDVRQFDVARDYYIRALKRDPTSRSILFNLAWLHYRDLKRPDQSIPYLKRLLKAHPNNSNAWLLLGYVHLNHTLDYKKARHAFEKALKVAPFDNVDPNSKSSTSATTNFELCRLYEKENDPVQAVACLEAMSHHFNDKMILNEITEIRQRYPQLFPKQ